MSAPHDKPPLSTLVSTPPVSGEAGIDWGDLLAGYQRICSEHGIEPTSGDVLAALKRHDAGEPMIPMSPTPRQNARAWAILQRMALERKSWWRRWFLPSEPLRNDAANLIREAKPPLPSVPNGTRLVGDAT